MISYSSTIGNGKSNGKVVALERRNIYGYVDRERTSKTARKFGTRCKSADASKSVLPENDI